MKLTIVRLGRFGPIAKQSDGYFRFQCPRCSELRATVNPRNNLAHCFTCCENFNNIDRSLQDDIIAERKKQLAARA